MSAAEKSSAPTDLTVVTKDAKAFIASVSQRAKVRAAAEALSAFRKFGGKVVCVSDDEMAALGEMRLKMRTGVRDIEEARKEGFRPYDLVKKMVTEHFKAQAIDPLEAAITSLDSSILAWQGEKQRRADEERRQREEEQRKAEEAAAQAVAEAADAGVPDDDAPPPFAADLGVVVQPDTRVRTETATTFLRTTLEAAVEDYAAAMKAWPMAFTFNPAACARAFKEQGNEQPKPGDNVLVGGVRFTVTQSVSGRAR